jgi:16S rRNA (cytosine967-C5)-methyltransferase
LLLERWLARMPESAVTELALHSLSEPPVLLNVEHAGPGASRADSDSLEVHEDRNHLVFREAGVPLTRLLASDPNLWVQDPSSAGAIRSIADLRPRHIIDLCAGQGTKTRQLAATFRNAEIIATDVDAARFARLKATFASSDQVRVLPFAEAKDSSLMNRDLVLLDVPCSNTGVLPRRPEARYRFSTAALESLAAVQRQLIADSIPLLTREPGARTAILYATCSLESDENADQAAWVRQWHRFTITRERTVLPAGKPGGSAASYRDGAYSVLLQPG